MAVLFRRGSAVAKTCVTTFFDRDGVVVIWRVPGQAHRALGGYRGGFIRTKRGGRWRSGTKSGLGGETSMSDGFPADRILADGEPCRLEVENASRTMENDFRRGQWSDLTEGDRNDAGGRHSLLRGDKRSQSGDVDDLASSHVVHDFLDTASLEAGSWFRSGLKARGGHYSDHHERDEAFHSVGVWVWCLGLPKPTRFGQLRTFVR